MINKLRKIGSFLKAFSLVELMVTLIAIAVITAAFTPTLSQKIKDSSVTVVGLSTKCEQVVMKYRSKTNLFCPAEVDSECNPPRCTLCDKNGCTWCGLNRTKSGYFVDEKSCTYQSCVPNCEKCPEDGSCLKCESGYELVDNPSRPGKKMCQPCPSGTVDGNPYSTYSSDGKICVPCPAAQYPNTDKTSCEGCKAGYACNIGKAKNRDVSIKKTCTDGKFSKDAYSECENCRAGTKGKKDVPTKECIPCVCGTFQSNEGETSCNTCTIDNYCTEKATSPSNCAPGYGSKAGSCECESCKNPHTVECSTPDISTVCETGFVLKDGKCVCPDTFIEEKDKCVCPDTQVENNGKCGCPGQTTKQKDGTCGCVAPLIKDSDNNCVCPGQTTKQKDGTCGCPTGFNKTTDNQCVCPGQTTKQKDGTCGCVAPLVKDSDNNCVCPGQTTKQKDGTCGCPTGFNKTTDNQCICPDGYEEINGKCELIGCPAGQYRDESGTCKDCPAGRKCAGGENQPEKCPATEYQDLTGQSECKPCSDYCKKDGSKKDKNLDTYCDDNAIWESSDTHVMKSWRSTSKDGKSCAMFCPYGYYRQTDKSDDNCDDNCCQAAQTVGGGTCGPGGTRTYVSKNDSRKMNGLKVSGNSCEQARGGFCQLNSNKTAYKCKYVYKNSKNEQFHRPANRAYQFPDSNPPSK